MVVRASRRWLNTIVHILNFVGDEMFITLMLPIIYWLWSKRVGFQLGIVIFISLYTNVLLKDIFQVLRPFQANKELISLVEQHGYSFPSGHSMHSFALWGFLAMNVKRTFFYVLASLMIISIGFARIYSGVHFMRDVLTGWLVSLMIILFVYWGVKRLSKFKWNNVLLIMSALTLSAIGLMGYHWLTADGLDQKGAYQACALLLFSIIGYVWEKTSIRFVIPQGWRKKAIASLIGIIGILIIKEGVKLILPAHLWSDFLRYGLIGFWTIGLAPFVFIKLKLYGQDRNA